LELLVERRGVGPRTTAVSQERGRRFCLTSPPAACNARQTSLACSTPMMLVGRAAPQRNRVTPAAKTASMRSRRAIHSACSIPSCAVDHDVGDRELAQVEQATHHVAVELFDDAGAMHEIDGARNSSPATGSTGSCRPASPTARRMSLTSHSTTFRIGENSCTSARPAGPSAMAMRSGMLKAAVFGSTSAEHEYQHRLTSVA